MGTAARDVVRARRQPGERSNVGTRYVVDIDEIAELVAVLEQLRSLLVCEPERKNPQRAVVGILKGLRPSLDRAVTKDDPFDPMAFAEQPDQVFLRQLAQAVGTGRSSHGLVGDHRRDRSAADRARRIPDAALERIVSAGPRGHVSVFSPTKFSLALDRHPGAED